MAQAMCRRWATCLGLALLLLPAMVGCGTLQVSVSVHGTPTPTAGLSELPGHLFGGGIDLVGYSLPTLQMAAGTETTLHLYWDVASDSPPPYAIGLALYTIDGAAAWNYSDQDAAWTRGRIVTEHRLRLPEDMKPGDYSLELWLYNPDSLERSSVKGPNRVGESGRVHIATLRVTQSPRPTPPGSIPLPPPSAAPATATPAIQGLTQASTATPVPIAVEGWTGTVVKLCAMAQYDDYFQRSDGEKYGIQGATDEIEAQVEDARCQPSTVIRVWGRLMAGVPDSNSRRITVERLEVVSVPATPVPEQGQGQTQVVGWQGRVLSLCRYDRLDNYFEREDGVCFGIDAESSSVKNELSIAECEGYVIHVWGVLYTGVDDYRNARIVVERLEHEK